MNKICEWCGGACCKILSVYSKRTYSLNPDFFRWLLLHENVRVHGNHIFILGRCKHLTEEGKCSDYKNRPEFCRKFRVSGHSCKVDKAFLGGSNGVQCTKKEAPDA